MAPSGPAGSARAPGPAAALGVALALGTLSGRRSRRGRRCSGPVVAVPPRRTDHADHADHGPRDDHHDNDDDDHHHHHDVPSTTTTSSSTTTTTLAPLIATNTSSKTPWALIVVIVVLVLAIGLILVLLAARRRKGVEASWRKAVIPALSDAQLARASLLSDNAVSGDSEVRSAVAVQVERAAVALDHTVPTAPDPEAGQMAPPRPAACGVWPSPSRPTACSGTGRRHPRACSWPRPTRPVGPAAASWTRPWQGCRPASARRTPDRPASSHRPAPGLGGRLVRP